MVTYWCVWCGETTERPTAKHSPQCTRCITEFQLGFGFPLRTLMVPLDGTIPPGEPVAARKRFSFTDQTGKEIWTTSLSRPGVDISLTRDDNFIDEDEVFTIYDVGA